MVEFTAQWLNGLEAVETSISLSRQKSREKFPPSKTIQAFNIYFGRVARLRKEARNLIGKKRANEMSCTGALFYFYAAAFV